ncbi:MULTISPECIES: hypothetical protein [Streptomyces]|uniref:hypothetical protein n=1 Tax=Streptomyces TaxID=1883 RepID=UPI002250EF11|nr:MULTISPECIES: hypothetical protein [Streptomyces]MCX5449241.1 hypothetical protein [Streptomyces libani]WDT54970.1 hypothetical protein NUT86_13350 [Streptomyces sp. G7(2002)]
MNRRHVRAAAVCGLVVVALTGAGGCALLPKPPIAAPKSLPTSGTVTEPESDITITSCHFDVAFGTLEAKLRVHNGNSRSRADYHGAVKFRDETGGDIGTVSFTVGGVGAGETRPVPVTDEYDGLERSRPKHADAKCKLDLLLKSNDEING